MRTIKEVCNRPSDIIYALDLKNDTTTYLNSKACPALGSDHLIKIVVVVFSATVRFNQGQIILSHK
jgi:hypothetical protein